MLMLTVLSYIGDIAFMISGINAARQKNLNLFMQLLSGTSVFCFGGIFRDIVLLHTSPSILNSPWEIAITIIIGVVTIIVSNYSVKKSVRAPEGWYTVLCIADALGLAGFAYFGFFERGITANAAPIICCLCAFATSNGGGLISLLLRHLSHKNLPYLLKSLNENRRYYLLGVLLSLLCYISYSSKIDSLLTLLLLSIIAVIIGLVINKKSNKREC
jgi:uncharacterized membrane protein YeiH